jgi:hypothetical protein
MGNFISHPSTLSSIASASTRVLAAWGFRKWFLRIAADMLADIGYIDYESTRFKDLKDKNNNLQTVEIDEPDDTNETTKSAE